MQKSINALVDCAIWRTVSFSVGTLTIFNLHCLNSWANNLS